jgi:hypothetical protein
VFFADPFAGPPSGLVAVQEVRLLAAPAASLGLGENHRASGVGARSSARLTGLRRHVCGSAGAWSKVGALGENHRASGGGARSSARLTGLRRHVCGSALRRPRSVSAKTTALLAAVRALRFDWPPAPPSRGRSWLQAVCVCGAIEGSAKNTCGLEPLRRVRYVPPKTSLFLVPGVTH